MQAIVSRTLRKYSEIYRRYADCMSLFMCCVSAGVGDLSSMVAVLRAARSTFGSMLNALEFIDAPTMELVERALKFRNPLSSTQPPFYALIEAAGADEAVLQEHVLSLSHSLFYSFHSCSNNAFHYLQVILENSFTRISVL